MTQTTEKNSSILNTLDNHLNEVKNSFDNQMYSTLSRTKLIITIALVRHKINTDDILINCDCNNSIITFDIICNDQEKLNNIADTLNQLNSIRLDGIQTNQAFFTIVGVQTCN